MHATGIVSGPLRARSGALGFGRLLISSAIILSRSDVRCW
jgi:hypothetical protein